jgi:hypothetical protein
LHFNIQKADEKMGLADMPHKAGTGNSKCERALNNIDLLLIAIFEN